MEIIGAIKIGYNGKRIHSAFNYKTLEEFNNQNNYKNAAWLNVQLLCAYPFYRAKK